jgi:antitoxin CptB
MSDRLTKGCLQWRCRRGTKELDVMLNRFLDAHYAELSDEELLGFNQLLDAQDTDLWMWLSGKYEADSETNKYWTNKIRTT